MPSDGNTAIDFAMDAYFNQLKLKFNSDAVHVLIPHVEGAALVYFN